MKSSDGGRSDRRRGDRGSRSGSGGNVGRYESNRNHTMSHSRRLQSNKSNINDNKSSYNGFDEITLQSNNNYKNNDQWDDIDLY